MVCCSEASYAILRALTMLSWRIVIPFHGMWPPLCTVLSWDYTSLTFVSLQSSYPRSFVSTYVCAGFMPHSPCHLLLPLPFFSLCCPRCTLFHPYTPLFLLPFRFTEARPPSWGIQVRVRVSRPLLMYSHPYLYSFHLIILRARIVVLV